MRGDTIRQILDGGGRGRYLRGRGTIQQDGVVDAMKVRQYSGNKVHQKKSYYKLNETRF